VIIDLRCRLTTAAGAEYFHDRMSKLGRLDRVPALGSVDEAEFFAEIGAAGITTAVSASGWNPGARLGRYDLPARTTSNDLLSDVQHRYPGRFVGVAGIDVSNTFHQARDEIDRCVGKLGLKAICIEPGRAPGCLLNERLLYPVYEQCQALGVTVIAQTSGTLGGRFVDYANPRYVEEIADDFRDLHIICGHGCYPFVREAIVMAARRDNVWLSPDIYFFHLGHEDWIKAINANLSGFADRFLFGSSYPLTAIGPYVENFMKIAWKPEVLERILWRNALRALKLEDDPAFRSLYGAEVAATK
jgi:predicted TIM-barrel fold metal-dependent hydrolase